MKIPLLDLAAEFQELEAELTAAVREVLVSGRYVLGPQVEALETEVARYIGVRHAIGVASGTDALLLALRAVGIRPGDEVIVPDFTFIATASAVRHAGARPVFADVDEALYSMTAATIEPLLSPRTRAVIVVHLYGQTAEVDAIAQLCARRGLQMIEDAAQCFGADFRGRRAGSWGAFGCFSFYPTKNLGAYGDGGMVATDDAGLAARVRLLCNHGSKGAYRHEELGYNSRLDELQAAILRVKLRHVDDFNARRRRHAALYHALLEDTAYARPVEHGEGAHVYHQFTVRHPAREAIRERLKARGIATAVHYPLPLHAQPILRDAVEARCPVAERLAREVFSLPMFPQLESAQVHAVAQALRDALREVGGGGVPPG